jgi:hypothetical protein
MINVDKNPNFSNWFDIRLFGKIVDNAKTHAKAMKKAKQLQVKTQAPILSNHG